MENKIKSKMQQKKRVVGTFFGLGSDVAIECLGNTGLDYIVIDAEHSPFDFESVARFVRTADSVGLTPLVRIPEITRSYVLRTLDIGAKGLIIPFVECVDQVKEIVQYAKYPPTGNRGYCACRNNGWGYPDFANPIEKYFSLSNAESLVITQCETVDGLEHIEEIAAMEGVDGVFLGMFDLSISMGKPLQFDDTELIAAKKRVLSACKAVNKPAIIIVGTIEAANEAFEQGFSAIAYSLDVLVFTEMYRNIVSKITE